MRESGLWVLWQVGLFGLRSCDSEGGVSFGVQRAGRWILAGLVAGIDFHGVAGSLVYQLEFGVDCFCWDVRWTRICVTEHGYQYLRQASQGEYGAIDGGSFVHLL